MSYFAIWHRFGRITDQPGVTRLLLAEALESKESLERVRNAIPDASIVICRLTASQQIAESRVRDREPGMLQEKFVARVGELDRILRKAALEDFCLHNDHASVTAVAHELLRRAGWI